MARAEDGLASVISTELNLALLSPDPTHADTITPAATSPALRMKRGVKRHIQREISQS